MKKWKQLVVFVMILTMVMGMTSFAADAGTGGNSGIATISGDTPTGSGNTPTQKPDTPNPPVEDNTGGNTNEPVAPPADNSATGDIKEEAKPAVSTNVEKAVVGGKEVEVELVVQTLDQVMTSKDKETITNALKAQAAGLTGFKQSSKKETFLFDVDMMIKGTSNMVGTSLEQTVQVSLDCSGLNFPAGTTKDNLRVLHYSWSKETWEKRTIISYVNGVITAEFNSFSPVAVVRSDDPVVDEDAELTNKTTDGWGLEATVPANKYNVINLKWIKQGSKKVKYELGIFNSQNDANPFKIISTKKTSYKFSKAECGKPYFFKVRVQGGSWSDVCYNMTTLTGVPTKVTAKSTYNTITLRWSKVKGAKYYNIYDAVTGKLVAGNVKGSKCTFKNMVTGETRSYYVTALRDKFEGERSATASAKPELAAVTGVKVRGLDSATVKVTWRKVKGATSYIVERWEDGWEEEPAHWEVITSSKVPVTTNSFVDNGKYVYYSEGNERVDEYGLTPNATYKYRVTAVRDGFYSKSAEGQGKTKNVPK